jgi:hypothetical protein
MMDHSLARALLTLLLTGALLAACSGPDQPAEKSANSPPASSTSGAADTIELNDAALETLRADFDATAADARYFAHAIDQNDDGQDELVVHVAGPAVCGTGGCNTLILTPQGATYRLVADISVTNPPIRVAASKTHGWRDLIVELGGGGGPAGPVLLRYDGTGYPEDPSDTPAQRLTAVPAGAEIVVPTFESFSQGRPLFKAASTTAGPTR